MTLIKNEDFIGTYNIAEVKSGIMLEINGSSTRLIDKKEDKTIVCGIDSINAGDDVIYGKCSNGYFLLTISDRKVIYSSIPMPQYFADILFTPREYYAEMTECIDNIGQILLIFCAIVVITIGLKKGQEGQGTDTVPPPSTKEQPRL
ncbi:MAG: hypothetical protein MJZ29_07415 [Bacteroidaceae bacterium]|nr:hypothetical protein [Bacteroidaceae bacterium]